MLGVTPLSVSGNPILFAATTDSIIRFPASIRPAEESALEEGEPVHKIKVEALIQIHDAFGWMLQREHGQQIIFQMARY